jgi:predicted nucleotidyltransferase
MKLKVKDINRLVKRGFISKSEKMALDKLIAELRASWPRVKAKIFGSKVKGIADDEFDLDILILLPEKVTENIRRQIIHKVFDINLIYETNLSPLIISKGEWENRLTSLLPIHAFIEEEGVPC